MQFRRPARLRRHGAAVTVVALALGGAATQMTGSAVAATHWSATHTKAVKLSSKAVKLGATPKSHTLHLTIGLTPRNQAAMQRALKAIYTPGSSTYRHYLTPTQWAAKYGATTKSVKAVETYLRHAGFTGVAVTGNHLTVSATGSVGRAEKAFHTSIATYRTGKTTVLDNVKPAMVPSSLSGKVSSVSGLNTLPLNVVKPLTRTAAGSPDLEGGLMPAGFDTTYDAKGTSTGSKTAIAILSEGNTSGVISSLRYAESKEHEKQVPVTVVKVGPQSTDTSGADEFDMDSQMSTGDATTVNRLYMYNVGSLTDAAVEADFSKWASQDKAKALSASIGGCEYTAYLDGSMESTDVIQAEAAMQGQTLFASSGDNGDACMFVAAIGAPAGVPGDNWPAVGTYTTAVGGTSLISDSAGNRIQELGWVGSGGGTSTVENAGFWTADSDPAYTATLAASGGRAVPDVALDADPNLATPAVVYVGKTVDLVGGTSLSSPLMLGFWSRLESGHGNKLGLASIDLYRLYDKVNPGTTQSVSGIPVTVPATDPQPVKGLTDITVGSNGAYSALPGYDEVTGLGAPDVAALNAALK